MYVGNWDRGPSPCEIPSPSVPQHPEHVSMASAGITSFGLSDRSMTDSRNEYANASNRKSFRVARWWTCLAVLLVPVAASGGEKDFANGLSPWLRKNCITCHNEKKASGGVDFSNFKNQSSAKARFDLWKKAVEQVRLGNMPPDDPLSAESKRPLVRRAAHHLR